MTCKDCEMFSVGNKNDYRAFIERHDTTTCEELNYHTFSRYLTETLRLELYFHKVGSIELEDLKEVLTEIFSAKLAELKEKEKENKK